MGIAVILVVGLALLMGLVMLPTVFDISVAGNLGIPADTPLYDIVNILPYAFFAIVIIGCFWAIKGT